VAESPGSGKRGIWGLSEDERLQLALALLARPRRIDDGREALRRRYPQAPDVMIDSATHHVYIDGPGAVVDFLADAELAIRGPDHEHDYGVTFHLLYHVYNWLQFRALLPDARRDMLTLLDQIEQAVSEEDREFLLSSVAAFRSVLEGSRGPPDFETA
jgi:hypothetical protein